MGVVQGLDLLWDVGTASPVIPGVVRGGSSPRTQGRAEVWVPDGSGTRSTPSLLHLLDTPAREVLCPRLRAGTPAHRSPARHMDTAVSGRGGPQGRLWVGSDLGSGVGRIPGAKGSAQERWGTGLHYRS